MASGSIAPGATAGPVAGIVAELGISMVGGGGILGGAIVVGAGSLQ
jgi:hypothetical protein